MSWTLGFVGCGVMAEVMIAGILDEGLLTAEHIIASNRRASRGAELHDRYGIRTTVTNDAVVEASDLMVLSVKPQNLARVMMELKGRVDDEVTVLSIVAGASMKAIQGGLEHGSCRSRHAQSTVPHSRSNDRLDRFRAHRRGRCRTNRRGLGRDGWRGAGGR